MIIPAGGWLHRRLVYWPLNGPKGYKKAKKGRGFSNTFFQMSTTAAIFDLESSYLSQFGVYYSKIL